MQNSIVYILGSGSRWRNREIMYSLRSLKNLKGEFKVFIIGICPKWIDKEVVTHIPAEDIHKNKLVNAIEKIKIACKDPRISDDFVLMNDDFFFLEPVDKIKLYNKGTLNSAIKKHSTKKHSTKGGYYYRAIKQTWDILTDMGVENPKDFEVHYPIIFNSGLFLKNIAKIDYKTNPVIFRSFYYNLNKQPSTYRTDCKAYNTSGLKKLWSGDFLSTDNSVVLTGTFQRFIKNKFKHISRFEAEILPSYYVKNNMRYGGKTYNPGDIINGNIPDKIVKANLIKRT